MLDMLDHLVLSRQYTQDDDITLLDTGTIASPSKNSNHVAFKHSTCIVVVALLSAHTKPYHKNFNNNNFIRTTPFKVGSFHRQGSRL